MFSLLRLYIPILLYLQVDFIVFRVEVVVRREVEEGEEGEKEERRVFRVVRMFGGVEGLGEDGRGT